MPTYKLTYFAARGRAELIRLIFHTGGVKFVDERIEGKDWPALKPSKYRSVDVRRCVKLETLQRNACAHSRMVLYIVKQEALEFLTWGAGRVRLMNTFYTCS